MSAQAVELLEFNGNDDDCTHIIKRNETTIMLSQGSHKKGSSKLKLKNLVDFNWEERYYKGRLIAMHIGGTVLAYAFVKPNSKEGLVRVIKTTTNERALIKGFSSLIEDISFAHLYEVLMLACINQNGTVHVYVINEDASASKYFTVIPILEIKGDPSFCFHDYFISWCQFVPEEGNIKELEYEPNYNGKILAVARGCTTEIWHIGIASTYTAGPIFSNFDLNKSFDKTTIKYLETSLINIDLKEDAIIVDIAFSADGSNVALALSSGSVYFYQISFENVDDFPKCVYNWHPQEVFLCLKSMIFLDNRKEIQGASMEILSWKYLVTMTNQNEIRLWCCESWECLQILSFVQPIGVDSPMKLTVDGTGKYLFLSNISNNLLYVMEVALDENSPKKSLKIVSVTEIILQSPILNMIIVDTKTDNDSNLIDLISGDHLPVNMSSQYSKTMIINLYAIQPKSLQEGQIIITTPDRFGSENLKEETKKGWPSNPIICLKSLLADDFPLPPHVASTNTNDFVQMNPVRNNPKLTPMEIHNLVKEKLKLKGIDISPKRNPNPAQNKKKIIKPAPVQTPIQSPEQTPEHKATSPLLYSPQRPTLLKSVDCSPPADEVQEILNNSECDLNETISIMEAVDYERAVDYSTEIESEETNCYTADPMDNRKTLSPIIQVDDNSAAMSNGMANQMDEVYTGLQELSSQLKLLIKRNNQLESQVNTALLTPANRKTVVADLIQNLEPIMKAIVKKSIDVMEKKVETALDAKLIALENKIVNVVSTLAANRDDIESFTPALMDLLSPALDEILKDLFMTKVVPKFEQACCSMFKQIDMSFNERSLEYQNELKSLLGDEAHGNSNGNKVEIDIEKVVDGMGSVMKEMELNLLNSHNELQRTIFLLLKRPNLQVPDSFVSDEDSISRIITNLLENGENVSAFETALSASNLELVLYVCENVTVTPEELFQNASMTTPIVLSLIQQLSFDLSNSTELKHKFLEAAVGSLDYTNDHHRENITLVLRRMETNIEKFLSLNPHNPFCRKIKMLQLAVKTMINFNVTQQQ
ncbi:enhancer of mRNA-decapping protein 4 [Adelges cooleyi]|uniref:enhancer of mRNA-decapping protein 4 n=1 Tax=Adelges cooleyi TaxID=133065 RepID=UPI0021807B49|nr:enhancer of mRNA-decapping protein 4 [Adelges cooleyi]